MPLFIVRTVCLPYRASASLFSRLHSLLNVWNAMRIFKIIEITSSAEKKLTVWTRSYQTTVFSECQALEYEKSSMVLMSFNIIRSGWYLNKTGLSN